MKLWLCVLSALLLAGCTAGTDVPGSVTPTAVPTPAATETGETAEVAATPAPTADAVQPPQGLVETGAAVLDYDEIRLIDYFREYQPYPDTDYYTMCRDDKWGLMRSDGTEVLPCRASEPLFECSWNAHHWHGYLDDLFGSPDYEAAYKAASQMLTESGDGRLCAEHDGGGYRQFVFLQDDKTYLYSGSMGPGQFITLTDDILRLFSGSTNGLVPAQSGTTTHESDEWYNFVGDGLYVYRYRNSGAANNFVYTAADCFFDAPLAAAQREGRVRPRQPVFTQRVEKRQIRLRALGTLPLLRRHIPAQPLYRRAVGLCPRRAAAERLCSRQPGRKVRPAGQHRRRACSLRV